MTQRAVIYARISLDQTGEGQAIERQTASCQSLADARGYEVVGVESDSQSAYVDKRRPGWERVKARAERGEVDVILAWQLDRITRSIVELEQLITLTERTGASVVTVSGELDLTSSTGRMLARILGAVARAEVETKAARQREANKQRAVKGRPFGGGPALFGYTPDGTVIEREAEAIREAAQDVLGGVSCYRIAKRLTEAGLFPRSTRRTSAPAWTPAGVKLMLVNPRLAGRSTYRGEDVGQGNWEPVIDEATSIQLRSLLLDPSRSVGSVKVGPKASTLLSGIARCGECDQTVQAGSQRGRPTYACKQGHTTTPRYQAEMVVKTRVLMDLWRAADTGVIVVDEPSQNVDTTGVDELRKRLDDLALSCAEGTITRSQLEVATARLREKIEAAEASIATTTSRVLGPEEAALMFTNASLDGQRAMLRGFDIKIRRRGRGGRMPITEQIVVELREAD